ncbi:hypothetical protein ABL78_6530 [Leptomonas seymouri]|uniref:Programmed cell death protein 2 C-terminal domain-containing protein n=1 Tax=Leptomonas seymouri TaxID=5684 RepID=A0A0N1HTP0_LEPSE|nr:hypothetical protein ABL78_6530 [Leptomonas seymouri]|eukprot:KPI84423.1 hypothetical protein ABL78_6530 [Leptomonas seymouri]
MGGGNMPTSAPAPVPKICTTRVLLGLFDGYMSLERDRLTSETKIGGSATYFPPLSDADKATIRRWTSCGVCGHEMSLLLQAYSPLPGAPANIPHHRMVYVFACNSSYCSRQPLSSMVAFSVQVDDEDTKALEEDEDEKGEDEVIETGPLQPSELPDAVLPPCYVCIDEEPLKEVVKPTDIERELIKMAEENAKCTVTDEELQQLEQQVDLKGGRTDYLYEKFRARVARAPNQVLRYYERSVVTSAPSSGSNASVKEARPIFMNPDAVKATMTIPACPACGAAQTAELQVMPTTLYYLEVAQYTALARSTALPRRCNDGKSEAASNKAAAQGSCQQAHRAGEAAAKSIPGNVDDGCDFGTLTVYVCSKDCAARQRGVVLRKETLCVEEAPTMRSEQRTEKEAAEAAAASGAPRMMTLRELLHGDGNVAVGDHSDADEDEEGEEAAATV